MFLAIYTKFLKMFPNFKWLPLFIGWCSILSSECLIPYETMPGRCDNCTRINSKGVLDYNENIACGCHRKPECKLLPMTTADLDYFRISVLKKHNAWRTKFAEGMADFKSAANMMDIGEYFGDLEYTSMCTALRCPRFGEKQKCLRANQYKMGVGQNVWSNWTDRDPYKDLRLHELMDKIIEDALQSWHNQIVYFPRELVSNFIPSEDIRIPNRPRNSYDLFSCLYWAKVIQIGCYISMRLGNYGRVIEHILVCSYGDAEQKPCNIRGEPVYIPGETCSQCPPCALDSNCCVGKTCRSTSMIITMYSYEHFVGSMLPSLSTPYDGHREGVKKVFVVHSNSRAEYIQSSYGFIALLLIISILL